MTGILLDTNALLTLELESGGASNRARQALLQRDRFVTLVSAIEIAIKHGVGKLVLPPPFQTSFSHAFSELVESLSADLLKIELPHIETLGRLPLHHRDPFDRLIIAQALTENLAVVTSDHSFRLYPGLEVIEL